MKVYFTFEPREDLRTDLMAQFPQINFVFEKGLNESHLSNCEVLVTYGEDLTEGRIAIATKLEWIFVASAGMEKMPAKAIVDRGIYVSNVRGIHKKPMAESILAHILSLKRGLPNLYKQKEQKIWSKKMQLTELNGSTAVILGPGAIGQEIGRVLQAFDVYTIGCNTSGELVSYMSETVRMENLDKVISRADILISILPSTKDTKGLLTIHHFRLMKDSAIFMNFGRGDLVAENVLVEALRNKEIAHAVLDVYEIEPLPDTSELWELDNVILSPHISSHSSRYVERSLEIFKPSLSEWLNGNRNLVNKVNLVKGY